MKLNFNILNWKLVDIKYALQHTKNLPFITEHLNFEASVKINNFKTLKEELMLYSYIY